MGFFNDLGKKTTQTTNKIAREAKLKLKINENKTKIKEIYEAIGAKIYQKHIREEDLNIKDELREECIELDKLSKEIEESRREILKLKDKKLCVKCFAEIETDMQFCPRCGERQTKQKTVFESAEEKLENTEISEDNEKEAEVVKEELKEKNNKQ